MPRDLRRIGLVQKLFEIIHEDPDLLAINKPAGLVCHPTKTDELSSLISRARLHLGQGAHPQLINRLDRETSGVVLVAKNQTAARALRRLWETRQVDKEYLAIVHGRLSEAHGVVDAPLGKDERSRVAIKDCVRPDGASAQTEYWVVEELANEPTTVLSAEWGVGSAELKSNLPPTPLRGEGASQARERQWFTVIRVVPRTGRKHQIRIHLAHLGHPIVGDKLYGGDEDLYLSLVENRLTPEQRRRLILPHHALHARAVRFEWKGKPLAFACEPEPWFAEFIRLSRPRQAG